jgi:hypothetical protein
MNPDFFEGLVNPSPGFGVQGFILLEFFGVNTGDGGKSLHENDSLNLYSVVHSSQINSIGPNNPDLVCAELT